MKKNYFSILIVPYILFLLFIEIHSAAALFSTPSSSIPIHGTTPSPYAIPAPSLNLQEDKKLLPDFSSKSCKTKKTLKASKARITLLRPISDQGFLAVGVIEKDPWTQWIGAFNSAKKPIWASCFYSTRPMEDEIHDLIVTSDSGYLAVGKLSGQKWNAWALKLDQKGKILWQKAYGLPDDQQFQGAVFKSVVATTDRGTIVSGYFDRRLYDWGSGISCSACSGHYGLLMKLDADGTMQWQKAYGMDFEIGTESVEGGFSFDRILATTDGGYFVSGSSSVFGEPDAWVARFDHDGNVLWQKQFGKNKGNMILGMIEENDGNIVLAGWLKSLGSGKSWGLKLDRDGKVLWQKSFGQGAQNWMMGLSESVDKKGSVFLASTTPKGISPDYPDILWIFQLDLNGNVVWKKGYSTSLNPSITSFSAFGNAFLIGSNADIFKADQTGTIQNPPVKWLKPITANFTAKVHAEQELATDIHEYAIPLEEGESAAIAKKVIMKLTK